MKRFCLLLLLLLSAALAAQQAIQVTLNGQKSDLPLVRAGDLQCVPVYVPLTPGDTEFKVTVSYDAKTGRADVRRIPQVRKKRGEETLCWQCSGTGKCQSDNPAGGGLTTSGSVCPLCAGNGKCWYCTGTGKAWK